LAPALEGRHPLPGHLVEKKFAAPVNQDAVATDWAARGHSCGLFVDPPEREWNGFVHATNELVTVTEGRLEVEIEGEKLVAGPGDEVFIPKGAVHSVRNRQAGTTRWLYGYDGEGQR
jgi:mannose-6-phosphate isomerase-like protein (cupin superfamily)